MLLASVYCERFGKLVAAVWVGVDVKRTTLGYLCPSVLSFKFDVVLPILTESYSFQFLTHSSLFVCVFYMKIYLRLFSSALRVNHHLQPTCQAQFLDVPSVANGCERVVKFCFDESV